MTSKSLLPSVSLDLGQFDARDRWDVWHTFNEGIFQIGRNRLTYAERYARARSLRIGDTFLSEYAFSGNTVRRRLRRYAVESEELLIIRIDRGGLTKGTMDGRNFEMKTSVLTIFDFHQPIEANIENIDYFSFMAPYRAVGYDPSIHPRFHQIPLDTPVGRTLQSNLELMLDLIPRCSEQEAATLSEGFCGLLRTLVIKNMCNDPDREHLIRSREVAARWFLAANVRDPSLNADAICKSIGVSRTVLYRMFEKDGGVRRAITRKRLERALKELVASETKRGAIARAARNWGFRDQAHFSRLFRETFGTRPSQVLGTASLAGSRSLPDALRAPTTPLTSKLSLSEFYARSQRRAIG